MAIINQCGYCEKEFNLQIKLKKHVQTAHACKKGLNPSHYLDEEIEFTDEEKAEYFDDLKAKCDEIKSKVDFFKNRYLFMQKGKDISLTKNTKVDDQDLSTKWEPPIGWTKLSRGFRASDGELLESVKQVVKYLRSKGYTEEYIDKYKEEGTSLKFLNREGLPSGWRSAIVPKDGCRKNGNGKITTKTYTGKKKPER